MREPAAASKSKDFGLYLGFSHFCQTFQLRDRRVSEHARAQISHLVSLNRTASNRGAASVWLFFTNTQE